MKYSSICVDFIGFACQTRDFLTKTNLANNGRVSHAVAAICSIAGIRVVGDVQDGLHPTDKCRGEKKAISTLIKNMKTKGYVGGAEKGGLMIGFERN